ncbi:diacylglycerol/lipid kinase family protein [Streptomyces sp. WM6378]|uniref:diacylglycerol/lipid kinase family protein n=1 Tax=Streptomyces sp. WM6378 TaxID=1415557 RepID=UPI001F2D3E5C|nr:diacylglycerol kinase family protein [Streptomyces sp. WM6378]
MDRGDLLGINDLSHARKCRVAIIANPAAGSTTRAHVASMESLCANLSGQVDVFWTERKGHAAEYLGDLLREGAEHNGVPDVLISVGGDGTLREVAEGIFHGAHQPSLIVMPGGTGNSNYRALWGDIPWQDALRASLTGAGGELRRIDLVRIDTPERLVMLGVSTGLFAAATAESRSISVAGRERYQEAISRVLKVYEPYMGRVLVDGTVIHSGATTLVNVGGGRHRAGVYNVLPRSLPDDGLLDVCVLDPALPAQTALKLMRNGDHLGHAGVTYARGTQVTLERTDGNPLHFESDGEVVVSERSSITVRILPGAVPVFANDQRPGG